MYEEAQRVAKSRAQRCTDAELLQYLRDFLVKNGTLTARGIRADLEMPCPQVYTQRFGSLMSAYRKIGFVPTRNMAYLERDRDLVAIRKRFTEAVILQLKETATSVFYVNQTRLIHVNDAITVRALVARYRVRENRWGWLFRLCSPTDPKYTVIARLAPGNKDFLDFYCVPRKTCGNLKQLTLCSTRDSPLDDYRFHDLEFLSRFVR